jgi:radical SAM superfamily enzyme YgiQ (UPF0313 family)
MVIVDSLDEALAFQPDIVGVSAVSQVIVQARQFAARCREECGALTVLGGYHVTCLPDHLPAEFDLGVLGEGEVTFAEVVRRFASGADRPASLRGIRGTCVRIGDEVTVAPRREMIADIGALPWPDRRRRYSEEEPLLTSRGCPYRCLFCASHGFWGDSLRIRSAGDVVGEMCAVVESCSPRELVIVDDLWMADKPRFKAIAELLVARGLPERVSLRGFCRSNIVGEEEIRILKRLNYRMLRFGAETGSERLLRRLKGPGISVADHERLIALCAAQGMPCGASFMFGTPGETPWDIEQTVGFLRRHKGRCSIMGLYLFNPIPGTALWDELAERGAVGPDLDFAGLRMDLLQPEFDWDRVPYFNEENVPRQHLREVVEGLIREFIDRRAGPGALKPAGENLAARIVGRMQSGLKRRFGKRGG